MALLSTHVWSAERSWSLLAERWGAFYGDLLFGTLGFEAFRAAHEHHPGTFELVWRNSPWHRHGQTGEKPVDRDLEQGRVSCRRRPLDGKVQALVVARQFDVESVVADSLDHCRARLLEMAEWAWVT
jgi:hypothetical protein